MSHHLIHIEGVFAEDLLELPENVYITDADFIDGNLVLGVSSANDLGAEQLDAHYGNIDEDEDRVHLGMLTPRK